MDTASVPGPLSIPLIDPQVVDVARSGSLSWPHFRFLEVMQMLLPFEYHLILCLFEQFLATEVASP